MSENEKGAYGQVLKYTGIFGGVQGLNIVVSLVRNKLAAFLLGPGGMGLVALFNATVAFVSQATGFGISMSAVRHISELSESGDDVQLSYYIKVVRAWSLLAALLGVLVCMAIGPFLNSYTFTWGNHTLHFILLAPAVGMIAITAGETAILKGTRQLKPLVVVQTFTILATLLLTVPAYYFFGETGIVPVIVLMAFVTLLFTINYSFRLYPFHLRGSKGILGEGMEMIRLGVAFTMAGIVGTGAEMLIRSWLNVEADLNVVGL